jgi:hypothetical protein
LPLYFAYGSNMDRDAMAARCPQSRAVGVARLPRHRFMIMADGYASVTRDARRTVFGVLWDIALGDMKALDRYEGLHRGLYAKISQPVITEKGAVRALIYLARSSAPGRPRPGYLEGVVAAARSWGLPEDYVQELATGEPPRRKPGTPLFRSPL